MRRYIYIPTIKKIQYKEGVLIERALPKMGSIAVSVGNKVEPSDRLGSCKVSYEIIELGSQFKPVKNVEMAGSVLKDSVLGKTGKQDFIAPFNGYLEKDENGYRFRSVERDYWLLPGVWGEVTDIAQNRSVLLKTQVLALHMPACSEESASGELIVFPNPQGILAEKYLDGFLKTAHGKIIYVGNSVTMPIIKKAQEVGVRGVLAGSAPKEVYEFAIKNNLFLGLFSGFGDIDTPEHVYNFLNSISNRYIFIYGSKHCLYVPVKSDDPQIKDFSSKKSKPKVIKYVKKDLSVMVFDIDNFAQTGKVDRVSESSIFVKLDKDGKEVQVSPPNIIAID